MRRFQRRGNVAIIVALCLVTFVAVGAVVVDISYGRLVQQQLQNAADAAAVAAASRIDGTTAGLTDARATGQWVAAENHAAGEAVSLDANTANAADGDIVFGEYDETTGAFTVTNDPDDVNGVAVRARLPALGLFIAPMVLGHDTLAVSATSRSFIKHGGAGATDCFIPLAMASCLVDRYGLSGLQNVTLKLQPAGIDNVGYGRPGASPNASWTSAQITRCQNSGEIEVGDMLGLQNGQATSVLPDFVNAVQNSTTTWSTAKWGTMPARDLNSSVLATKYGHTFEGVVPVFDGGTSYCTGTGGSYNGTAPIKGFVWGAIYDVINKGSSASRTIKMRLDFTRTYDVGTQTGGPEWGVVANDPPRIIPG